MMKCRKNKQKKNISNKDCTFEKSKVYDTFIITLWGYF